MCTIEIGMKPASRDSLCAEFKALGIQPNDVIMLHASYKALGLVAGGPDTVIDGLMDAVGDNGGILIFVSWGQSTYEAFAERHGLTASEREAWPEFDPSCASVRPSYAGAIGACLVQRPDACRSANPDRSLAALGSGAKVLIDEHRLDHGFGPGSPLERFVKSGGKSLLLGAPLSTVSVVHYAEYLCNVPNKQFVTYEVPLLNTRQKAWCPVTQMDRDGFVPAARSASEDYVEQVTGAYIESCPHHSGRVGQANAYLFEAADYVDFAVAFLERRFGSNAPSAS